MKTVNLKGTIVSNDDKWIYEWFDYEATCPKDIIKALEDAAGEDITVIINSGGGDVFAGNEMAYVISQYRGNTTADIAGFCGSAATIVACATNKARCYPTAMYMIHNVSSGAQGDYHEMDKQSEVLKTANEAISKAYQQKTGKSEKDLLELMDKETWMSASEAKENGFIDEIIGENGTQNPFTINNSFATILTDEVKQKIRNMVKNPGRENNSPDFSMESEKIKLLRMKGERL